jgi:hypothetical protein
MVSLDPTVDGESYERAKLLWLKHIETYPSNVAILSMASRFFINCEPGRSEALMRQVQALDPPNPEWSERLSHILSLRDRPRDAFAELEKSYSQETDELKRWWMLPNLANKAFEAGEENKARVYAEELLERAQQPGHFYQENGRAIYYGHLVMGRLALRDGDLSKGKEHLLKSATTKGDSSLKSFGPNMTLAKELLERGERDVVIRFLKLCTNFWKTPDHQPEQWMWQIEQGKMPDFGANLRYG